MLKLRSATMQSAVAAVAGLLAFASFAQAGAIRATPATYRTHLRALKPGDTLMLEPGNYPRLNIIGLNGTAENWITITGPLSGPRPVMVGAVGYNTVMIENSSYVAVENLTIDSRGIPGAFGLAAHGREESLTHNIRVEGNVFIGQNGGQQTVAISTKTPTWGWIIRNNRIDGAGTGMYLGDSDGGQPFVAGLIENNLVQNTIGYNLQIKHQNSLPPIEGMPLGPTSTIIRNNVFRKNDQPSPDGDRPNVLLGGFPLTGSGSLNIYEVYGNYFVHNSREALFQASGRVTVHDNVFVDGPYTYSTVVFQSHESPLKLAYFYNNTVYTNKQGVHFGARALVDDAVVGNVIFATTPVSGLTLRQSDNITDYPVNAPLYVTKPSNDLASMNFFPLPGKCQGSPLDLSIFRTDTDYALDINGTVKAQDKGVVVYRGAYAGEGQNPGAPLRDGIKPPRAPTPFPAVALLWINPPVLRPGEKRKISLTGANFSSNATLDVDDPRIKISQVNVASSTEITAIVGVDPAASGTRSLTVHSGTTASNVLRLRISR
jgi:hypothetical protein